MFSNKRSILLKVRIKVIGTNFRQTEVIVSDLAIGNSFFVVNWFYKMTTVKSHLCPDYPDGL